MSDLPPAVRHRLFDCRLAEASDLLKWTANCLAAGGYPEEVPGSIRLLAALRCRCRILQARLNITAAPSGEEEMA